MEENESPFSYCRHKKEKEEDIGGRIDGEVYQNRVFFFQNATKKWLGDYVAMIWQKHYILGNKSKTIIFWEIRFCITIIW